jgi:hypothetical protein
MPRADFITSTMQLTILFWNHKKANLSYYATAEWLEKQKNAKITFDATH